ncbi:MAG: hypothetical protein QOG21_1356 [Actinomycetota bacterium]|jgi:hypothetical protein|nr:hypothetical protein [Actinomycetota bacterium]
MRILRRTAAWALAVTMVLLPLSAVAAPRQVPINNDASARPGNEAENAIAANPTRPSNIVAMSTLPDVVAGLFEGVSFDGGKTWTRRTIGTGGPLGAICCDEQLAWDHFGNLWMTYLVNSDGNIDVAVSTDGGLSFRKVTEIVPTKPTGSRSGGGTPKNLRGTSRNVSGDQPSIATGDNSVWVSYTTFPSVQIQASGATVTGLGSFDDFSSPETVPTSNGRGDYGDTAVGPAGQVMVTYQDSTNGQGGSHIYTATDRDGVGRRGFTDPVLVARSRVGGFDYLPAKPNRSIDAEANLAWDRSGGAHSGRAYVVWVQESPNESDDTNIMLQHSDNAGRTWSRAVRLNRDHTVTSQFDPAIALDQTTGNLALSWYDARNDLGRGGPGDTDGVPNDDVQVWGTFTTDGGHSFAPNFRISQGTSNAADAGSYFDFGDYTHAAFVSGSFYPAWSDNSNSTGTNPDGTLNQFDLYTARVAVP